jgi:cellulose synthase/poly-beta-1,6-N-acetylglucosamine synthase-like glycosyltransferase
VEKHCKKLGRKFTFFHVDPLFGAKAGALNFALEKTAPDTEIIGVIDADYQAHPHFIRDLIGHFEDPRVGFVQTPHDYREWENNTYLSMCYWEYKAFFHTILVALNERDAALTIGTMCLLRKQAIIDAGGWATWCVTEDSELSIRIHDKGYSSVYIPVAYGKGLIPSRLSDYATQRYRWIAGPVQEFKHYFTHLIGVDKKNSSLTLLQRLHHFHHGFGSAMFSLNIPFLFLSIALAVSMMFHHEIIPVPFALWVSVTTLLVTSFALSWLQ